MAAGDYVIMDNGAYEGEQLSSDQLIKLCADFQPDCVVLPDEPGSLALTVKKSFKFVRRLGEELDERLAPETMFVLHAKDGELKDFVAAYEIGVDLADCIGFSKLTKSYGLMPLLSGWQRRAKFAFLLQHEGLWANHKDHHALGMLEGEIDELPLLAKAGFDSVDSSVPVWHGLNGYGYDQLSSWPHYQCDLGIEAHFSEANIELAERELKRTIEACQK